MYVISLIFVIIVDYYAIIIDDF